MRDRTEISRRARLRCEGRRRGSRYKLLPVFSNLLPADKGMNALIEKIRAPYATKFAAENSPLPEGLLFRRGNFNGTFDQLILDGLMKPRARKLLSRPASAGAPASCPARPFTLEHLMDQTAITYPMTTLNEFTGEMIRPSPKMSPTTCSTPTPYYPAGRRHGARGRAEIHLHAGRQSRARISDMKLGGKLIDANKKCKVAGWAPVAEGAGRNRSWDITRALAACQENNHAALGEYLPKLYGVAGTPGWPRMRFWIACCASSSFATVAVAAVTALPPARLQDRCREGPARAPMW